MKSLKDVKPMKSLNDEQKKLFDKLTELQKNVCLKKMEGLNDIDSYVSAGGKGKLDNTQRATISKMLTNINVANFLLSVKNTSISDTLISRERILKIFSDIALNTDERTTDRMVASKHIIVMQGWDAKTAVEIKKLEIDIKMGSALVEDIEEIKKGLAELRFK